MPLPYNRFAKFANSRVIARQKQQRSGISTALYIL